MGLNRHPLTLFVRAFLLRAFVRALALPGALVAAALCCPGLRAGKHKELWTGDTPAPQENNREEETQSRAGNGANHGSSFRIPAFDVTLKGGAPKGPSKR